MPNVLNHFVNTNINLYINYSNSHSKLDILFTYSMTLMEVSPNLLENYKKIYG